MTAPTIQTVTKTVTIAAPAAVVWTALTSPAIMRDWMFDAAIDIVTDWTVGRPFVVRGDLHGVAFENTGTVLEYAPGAALSYSHRSSLSNLPDEPGNYSVVALRLAPDGAQTSVELRLSRFPTEAIHKHLAFYWNSALARLKAVIENGR